MTDKVKIIYNKSTKSGFNQNDSAMLYPSEAALIVKSGDAHYDKAPVKSKVKEKGK